MEVLDGQRIVTNKDGQRIVTNKDGQRIVTNKERISNIEMTRSF